MSITLAQICNAIETTLATATTVVRSESYDELTEGIHDLPMLQIYPEGSSQSPPGATDRHTFGGAGNPVRQTEFVIHADYYARQRAHIGEDMAALVDGIDALQDVLEGQDQKPYFGLDGLKAFSWRWDRVTFVYADVNYIGARFMLLVRVF